MHGGARRRSHRWGFVASAKNRHLTAIDFPTPPNLRFRREGTARDPHVGVATISGDSAGFIESMGLAGSSAFIPALPERDPLKLTPEDLKAVQDVCRWLDSERRNRMGRL